MSAKRIVAAIQLVFVILTLAGLTGRRTSGQETSISIENLQVYGQEHGFPNGLWPDGLFGSYLRKLGDFDGNGVDDLVVDAHGYTIVLLKEDGTVIRMLPGHELFAGVIGPGDLNKDGIPDLAYLKDQEVWIAYLDAEGWISEKEQVDLEVGDDAIGSGFYPDKLHRVGDVNNDGLPDIGISLQSNISMDLRNRRFGVAYLDLSVSENSKGSQYVDWDKGDWMTGDPANGLQIDFMVQVIDLQDPVDGIKDFLLLSKNQEDKILTNYIDFNVDGTANHYLASTPLPVCYVTGGANPGIFDEPNPSSGDFRFRYLCATQNYLVDLSKEDKEVVFVEEKERVVTDGNGSWGVIQVEDFTGDGIRDYFAGKNRSFFNDNDSAYIQSWSENDGHGPKVNSYQNGGWKILRPGDQYGSAISLEPMTWFSNSGTQIQLMGVRARRDARGSFMWHTYWTDTGVVEGIGTFYTAETNNYQLNARDLFGHATDVLTGFVTAPGRNNYRGGLFRIGEVKYGAIYSARYVDPAGTYEIELSEQLLSELRAGDEFGASIDGFVDENSYYTIAVGAYEKNKNGGKNTGAVYFLRIEDGAVVDYKEVGRNTPILGSMLDSIDHFGASLAFIGDLDGNGYQELAVGARVDDDGGHDRGAVYILFLDASSEIIDIQKISMTQGGFTGQLPNSSFFGESLARLGDVNNDGIPDLAVGSPRMGDGTAWILTLNANGTVKSTTLIDESIPGISYDDNALFGGAMDANVCPPQGPDLSFFCRDTPKLWIGARGNNEHHGTIWAFDFELGIDGTIPVELTRLEAVRDDASVLLSWHVASEINNAGFQIERRVGREGQFEKLGFVEGAGTAGEASYSFKDLNPVIGYPLFYRLKQIDFDGAFEYSDVVKVAAIGPSAQRLFPNYPNPFNPSTTIAFDIPVESPVRLTVHDLTGREVRMLFDKTMPAGRHEAVLNGADLASGMYIYRLTTPQQTINRIMTLLK